MKRFLSIIIAFVLAVTMSFSAFSEENFVSAKSAILINGDTLEILYSKNCNSKMPIASTTKIMTAIIAIEYGVSDELITVTDEMVNVEGSSMGLKSGDKVSTKTLLKGLMLKSGNDAANALAIIVGGSIDNFVILMNDKASQLSMNDTNFENPSGLPNENHYSTCYDMAILASYALKNSEFLEICSSKEKIVFYGNPPYRRVLNNHNKFLSMYDGAVGVKTGFTKKSGRCLVTAVKRDNATLIAVTLNAPNDWDDHKKMYDYAFNMYEFTELHCNLNFNLKVIGGDKDTIPLKIDENIVCSHLEKTFKYSYKIYSKKFEYAPIEKGEIVGAVVYYNDNNEIIGKSKIVADDSVSIKFENNKTNYNSFLKYIKEMFRWIYGRKRN